MITFFKRTHYLFRDKFEVWTGKRDPLTPPRWLHYVGGGDFKAIGGEFFRYFVELGRLQPHDTVLDVGCGIGRMAVPLMDYLKDGGRYEGFDIVKNGIQWCRKAITRRAGNFHFIHADIFNYAYNPTGTCQSGDYRFPYTDQTFDFVFLTSVFTHMLPPDMEHYHSEISRVLKPGGRCLITYFLLNRESLEAIDTGTSSIGFKHQRYGYLVNDPAIPEAAVAYPEEYIKELYEKNGMKLCLPVQYGSWCGRKEFLSYQDIIVAEKGN